MQKFAALIITSFLATPAFATWIAPVSASVCTRDFNAWGQASTCQCPHATRYENRLGACVQGAPVAIEVEGYVAPELNLDGDVVAYTLNKTETESFKVILPLALRPKFEEKEFQSLKFRISGEVIENYDGSVDAQPTIILEKIEPLDVILEDLVPNRPELNLAD